MDRELTLFVAANWVKFEEPIADGGYYDTEGDEDGGESVLLPNTAHQKKAQDDGVEDESSGSSGDDEGATNNKKGRNKKSFRFDDVQIRLLGEALFSDLVTSTNKEEEEVQYEQHDSIDDNINDDEESTDVDDSTTTTRTKRTSSPSSSKEPALNTYWYNQVTKRVRWTPPSPPEIIELDDSGSILLAESDEDRAMPSRSAIKTAGRYDLHHAIVAAGGYQQVAEDLDRWPAWPPNAVSTSLCCC